MGFLLGFIPLSKGLPPFIPGRSFIYAVSNFISLARQPLDSLLMVLPLEVEHHLLLLVVAEQG